MGNFHSYNGPTGSLKHRLDQSHSRSLYIDDTNETVSNVHPASINQSTSSHSSKAISQMFADLPPDVATHGIARQITALLTREQSGLNKDPVNQAINQAIDQSAFETYIDLTHTRLSRQHFELAYHHLNQTMMHSISNAESLDKIEHAHRSIVQNQTWTLLRSIDQSINQSSEQSDPIKARLDHTRKAQEFIQDLSSMLGRGKLVLSDRLKMFLHTPDQPIGLLWPVSNNQTINQLMTELHLISQDSLSQEEMERSIKFALNISVKTLSASHMSQTIGLIFHFIKIYGNQSINQSTNQELMTELKAFSANVTKLITHIPLINHSSYSSEAEQSFKQHASQRIRDAHLILNQLSDHSVSQSILSFVLMHLAVLSEVHIRYEVESLSMTTLTGACSAKPAFAAFEAPLVLDFKPESPAPLIDMMNYFIAQRLLNRNQPNSPSKPDSFKIMYNAIRSLFPPHTQSNSVQAVRLLLPILKSACQSVTDSAGQSSQFQAGPRGPLYEYIEEFPERRKILEMNGFRVIEKKQSDDSLDHIWHVDHASVDLPLLTYTVEQLERLNSVYYDPKPIKETVEVLSSRNGTLSPIMPIISLLRTFFLVAKRNRVSVTLLTRANVLCEHRTPMMLAYVEALISLIGKDDDDWNDSEPTRWDERLQCCHLLVTCFSMLVTTLQVRVMQHSLVSTPLRTSLLAMLQLEPMSFTFGPSQFSFSSSQQTVFERVCKGVHRDKGTCSLLSDGAVVDWLISCHDQGSFSLKHGQPLRSNRPSVKLLHDWLSKPSSFADDGSPDQTLQQELSSDPSSPVPRTASPNMTPSLSEEKKDEFHLDASPRYALLSSPPILIHQRSVSSLPAMDSLDLDEYHALFDTFFFHLTSPQSCKAVVEDVLILLKTIQHALFVRVLTPFCQFDRTHTPHLLLALASSMFHHAHGFITSLKHEHGAQTSHDYSHLSTQPMTSLNPSFPPSRSDVPAFVTAFHGSPFSSILSKFLLPFSFAASLPRLPLPLDEQILGSMHSLMAECGGYVGLDDESELAPWLKIQLRESKARWFKTNELDSSSAVQLIDKEVQALDDSDQVTSVSYQKLNGHLLISSVLVEPFLAPDPTVDKLTVTIYDQIKQSERADTLLKQASAFKEDHQIHSLGNDLLSIIDAFVFGEQDHESRDRDEMVAPGVTALHASHLTFPSLYVCIDCGHLFQTQRELVSHAMPAMVDDEFPTPFRPPRSIKSSKHDTKSSLCCQPNIWFMVLRMNLLWALVKVSRHMAAACPPVAPQRSAPVNKNKPVDADERERPITGVENDGMPRMPQSIDDWLNSDLMKPGLEDNYVAAPSASMLPPLDVSISSSIAPSRSISKPVSPLLASRTEKQRYVDGSTVQTSISALEQPGGEMLLPEALGLTAGKHALAYSEHDKSSSPLRSMTPNRTYELSDSESAKVMDDLHNKGKFTVESPRGTVTMTLSVATPDDLTTSGTPPLDSFSYKLDPSHSFQSKQSSGDYIPSQVKFDQSHNQFLRAPPALTSLAEPYEHANFLYDLIYGDRQAGTLDAVIMEMPTMKMYWTKRKMVGHRGVEASRAIIAVLLKHMGRVELALDELSEYDEDSSHPIAPALLKVWKQGSEILTDFISTHQQGMQYKCTVKGCEADTQEMNDLEDENRFKCSAGHFTHDCIEIDTQTYDEMAERVIKNCQFLLKLKPSLSSSPTLQLARLNSIRVKKILRIRPPESIVDGPYDSPPDTEAEQVEHLANEPRPESNLRSRRRSSAQLLTPAPALTWSTTSATQQQLLRYPEESFSPLSAPVVHQRGMHSKEDSLYESMSRRGSVGAIPTMVDDSLLRRTAAANKKATQRDNLKRAVRRELQARKWKELRDDLLLHRNSLFSGLNRIPLSTLILQFAKDHQSTTSHLTESLDDAMRSSILRAERRIKGLESLCLMVKLGGLKTKLLALNELQCVVREWSIDPNTVAKASANANGQSNNQSADSNNQSGDMSTASLLPSPDQPATEQKIAPSKLQPSPLYRYDNGLLTCGATRLSLVADAFYVLGGVNVSLMRQCINAILTSSITSTKQENYPFPANNHDTDFAFEPSERSSPGETIYRVNQPLSPQSSSLTPSNALSLLVQTLSCWQISFHRSDFTFLRNTGILPVIETLIQSYPSVKRPQEQLVNPAAGLPISNQDFSKAITIGVTSRSLFRLLALECLTQENEQSKPIMEDVSDTEEPEPSFGQSHQRGRRASITTASRLLAVDSFENALLNAIFSRLEAIVGRIHERSDQHAPSGSRTISGRSLRDQMSMFVLSPEAQTHQDEDDCADLLALLLLSCSSARIRLSLTHARAADSAPPSPSSNMLSPFSSFSLPLSSRCLRLLLALTSRKSLISLSTRCARRALRLCQLLLPLLTPDAVEISLSTPANRVPGYDGLMSDDEDEGRSAYVDHLVSFAGYMSCGRHAERGKFVSSSVHSSAVASELISLIRLLGVSSSWSFCVNGTLAASVSRLQHRQFSSTDEATRAAFYRGWGALSVFGGAAEPCRVGARVRVDRVQKRNEKLSHDEAFMNDKPDSTSRFATVVSIKANIPTVVYEGDSVFKTHQVSMTQCLAQPVVPCLIPLCEGEHGAANLAAVVRFINQAFCSPSPSSVFALYPPPAPVATAQEGIQNKDQQLNYIHSLCKVLAVRCLAYAISFSLNQQLNEANDQHKTQSTSLSMLMQAIVRDLPAVGHPPSESAKAVIPLMSNLLSIAQNTIPLTQCTGRLEQLEHKRLEIHALLHERALGAPPVPPEMKQHAIHTDLCHRAVSLFGSDVQQGIAWLKRKHIEIKLLEDERKKHNERTSDAIRGLQDMGFDAPLCHKALLLTNGDVPSATTWLMDRGMQFQDEMRHGRDPEQWGLDGVDFYQEKGHWVPEQYQDVPGDDFKNMTGEACSVKDKHVSKINDTDSLLGPILQPSDPYRRLTLQTAPLMKLQSERNERAAEERRGLEGLNTVTCSLDEEDLRIGQSLRLNSAWCTTKQVELDADVKARRTHYVYRWYFLTEDNNWAPLENKDAHKLEETLESGVSVTWIGVEDKVPSLVRLDKMCMYSEHSGHGRPLKRRRIEIVDGSKDQPTEPEPDVPVLLFNTLTPELQSRASELAVLGFPMSHCARAMLETRGSTEIAANWIMNNENLLHAMDKEEERKKQKRLEWEKKQRELREQMNQAPKPLSEEEKQEAVIMDEVIARSGLIGIVRRVSNDRQRVLMSFADLETSMRHEIWTPVEALEWDDSRIVRLLPELNTRKFQGLSGLALDVASSEFIIYARRCVLLLLFVLSSGQGGKMEMIKNLSAAVFLRVCKLANVDIGSIALPISIPQWLQTSADATSNEEDNLNLTRTLSTKYAKGRAVPTPSSSSAPVMVIDLWRIINTVLHNPSPVFGYQVRDQLLLLLLDDIRHHLMVTSAAIRDVDTEHPYTSSITEKQEVRIEQASHLLVTFDRRCNLNQSHACLSFFADAECTQELAVFSGSAEEFSHVVIQSNVFYYQFVSGSLRQKPYEFGFRFRVQALNLMHKDEASVLGASLGWPVLALVTDSIQLIETVLGFHVALDYIETMLRYLAVSRSPCKVLVVRSLTALCAHIKQSVQTPLFESLIRIMEQLYESNTASGWGSSPLLISLVDLIRVRPTFRLSDSELWTVDSIDNRPPGWFFLTVLRAESLSKSLFHSARLPNIKLVERAFHELSDTEILRWCLKQPELCLKLHKQTKGWNSYRRDWMTGINGFTTFTQAAEVLIALKQSLLPECYRDAAWTTGDKGKEWEESVKKSGSVADISVLYMELEAALKWGDAYPEADRAFGDTWASRRPDWLAAMKGLAQATLASVVTPQECIDYRWNRAMDEQLVLYVDELANRTARRLMSLTFRDLDPISQATFDESTTYSMLRNVPVEHLRGRFAVLKMLSTDAMRVLPVVDLSLRQNFSLAPLMRAVSKTLIFHQSKMYLWRSMLGRLYSEDRPQFVILNRHEAAKVRKTAESRLNHSLFYQLYSHIGLLSDPASLRRRGQAWMVKFVAEGGHDVGGLYNESLVDICSELQSEGSPHSAQLFPLPLLRLCPNGRHGVGENRNKYIPNSGARSPLELSMFEFLGRLMGICCLDNNRALPLDLASLVWKYLANEPLTIADLRAIDTHAYNTLSILRNPQLHQLDEDSFEYLFPSLFFTVESSWSGAEIELVPEGGRRPVTFDNRLEYADLFESYRLHEFDVQLAALARGLASIVPFDFLSLFSWEQLEIMITGSPEIDLALLAEKTEYRGSLTAHDTHIKCFWEVLSEFSAHERSQFVQFTSGRSRLPQSALGFGKDMFKISEHAASQSGKNVDDYLPIAHTCFFALELPRYTSKEVMRDKLLYAIHNCTSIDGDATAEGRTNLAMTWSDSD